MCSSVIRLHLTTGKYKRNCIFISLTDVIETCQNRHASRDEVFEVWCLHSQFDGNYLIYMTGAEERHWLDAGIFIQKEKQIG